MGIEDDRVRQLRIPIANGICRFAPGTTLSRIAEIKRWLANVMLGDSMRECRYCFRVIRQWFTLQEELEVVI